MVDRNKTRRPPSTQVGEAATAAAVPQLQPSKPQVPASPPKTSPVKSAHPSNKTITQSHKQPLLHQFTWGLSGESCRKRCQTCRCSSLAMLATCAKTLKTTSPVSVRSIYPTHRLTPNHLCSNIDQMNPMNRPQSLATCSAIKMLKKRNVL